MRQRAFQTEGIVRANAPWYRIAGKCETIARRRCGRCGGNEGCVGDNGREAFVGYGKDCTGLVSDVILLNKTLLNASSFLLISEIVYSYKFL